MRLIVRIHYIYIAILHRAVPTYLNPYMYKVDSEGEILLDRGDEYYDDSIQYDGVYIHFAKQILEVSSSRGDCMQEQYYKRFF